MPATLSLVGFSTVDAAIFCSKDEDWLASTLSNCVVSLVDLLSSFASGECAAFLSASSNSVDRDFELFDTPEVTEVLSGGST